MSSALWPATFRLTAEALRRQRDLRAVAKTLGRDRLTPDELAVMGLPEVIDEAPSSEGPGSGLYEVFTRRRYEEPMNQEPTPDATGTEQRVCANPVCGKVFNADEPRKYCSRACTVRVAHARAKERKSTRLVRDTT